MPRKASEVPRAITEIARAAGCRVGVEVAVLLSRSPEDARPSFTGGAFLVSEQRPGQQTQIEALTLKQGKV
ncbi:MAG: hypothetical protein ABGW98_22015 [Myxococcales bacterium]|nr:hypothetical protein [Myxococcales bacterium]